MEVVRYCGHEKLQGGARRWQRLARAVGFKGRVLVFGYGVKGAAGLEHRRAMRTGVEKGLKLADFEPGLIRVWMPCSCAAAEFDNLKPHEDPLSSFAHELGHHVQNERGVGDSESVAERYGRMLLRSVL